MIKYIIGLIINLFNPGVSIFAKIDNRSSIDRKAKIRRFTRIFNSNIGAYTYVCSKSSLVFVNIGKFCSIAGNCSIGMGTHTLKNISTSSIFTTKKNATGHSWTQNNVFEEYNLIIIGNDVWIGSRVIIMGGVKIGDGAVIGAGAVVTKDIPPYAIAVGIPAKVIKYRFENGIIEKLMDIKWWNMPEKELKKKIHLFQKSTFTAEDLDKIHDNK